MVKFKIFDELKKQFSRVATCNFKRANFKLLREIVSSVPCEFPFEVFLILLRNKRPCRGI